jgi:hypothetical protein
MSNTPYDTLRSQFMEISIDRDDLTKAQEEIADWFIEKMKAHDLALREAIEGMRRSEGSEENGEFEVKINWANPMYNQALTDVLALLSSNKEIK